MPLKKVADDTTVAVLNRAAAALHELEKELVAFDLSDDAFGESVVLIRDYAHALKVRFCEGCKKFQLKEEFEFFLGTPLAFSDEYCERCVKKNQDPDDDYAKRLLAEMGTPEDC